jgi:hypothetical protein
MRDSTHETLHPVSHVVFTHWDHAAHPDAHTRLDGDWAVLHDLHWLLLFSSDIASALQH